MAADFIAEILSDCDISRLCDDTRHITVISRIVMLLVAVYRPSRSGISQHPIVDRIVGQAAVTQTKRCLAASLLCPQTALGLLMFRTSAALETGNRVRQGASPRSWRATTQACNAEPLGARDQFSMGGPTRRGKRPLVDDTAAIQRCSTLVQHDCTARAAPRLAAHSPFFEALGADS